MKRRFETHPVAAAFGEDLARWDKAPSTIVNYCADATRFIAWFEEQLEEPFCLAAVTEYDVRAWRDHLAREYKPATVNRKLAAVSALFHWALDTKQVEQRPTRFVKSLAEQNTAPKALSRQEMNRILRKARQAGDQRDIAMLELLAATGLRAGEVAALQVGDLEINERSGWVTVRASNAKGRKQRRVPLNLRARRAIQAYLDTRTGLRGDDPLFVSVRPREDADRQDVRPATVWYTVKKYARAVGLDDVSPHTFRHSVATWLVRNPAVDMVTVATYLGHSRLDTTARYSQPSEDDLSAAADELAG